MTRDLTRMLKEAQKLEQRLEAVRKALETQTVDGTAGGGAVAVQMNGQRDVLAVRIDPSVLEGADATMLEDLLLSALRDARQKADELAAREMGSIGAQGISGL